MPTVRTYYYPPTYYSQLNFNTTHSSMSVPGNMVNTLRNSLKVSFLLEFPTDNTRRKVSNGAYDGVSWASEIQDSTAPWASNKKKYPCSQNGIMLLEPVTGATSVRLSLWVEDSSGFSLLMSNDATATGNGESAYKSVHKRMLTLW